MRFLLSSLLLLTACSGGNDSTAGSGDCEEPLPYTYTGPGLQGGWTSTFGQSFYDSGCDVSGFSQNSEGWIGAFNIEGSLPTNIYLYYGSEFNSDTERFYGGVDKNGGVSFSGIHDGTTGKIHAQFGGLAYEDQYLDKVVIIGTAFLGLDVDDDNLIDCYARGSWTAYKSGL